MSFSPVLTENKLMLMTHAAESSAFSDKTLHPFVGRMSKSAVNVQAHALVNVVQSVVKHTSAKLISCDDSYCKDCARNVQQRAREIGVELAREIVFSERFRTESGRMDVRNFLADCSKTRVVIMCTLEHQVTLHHLAPPRCLRTFLTTRFRLTVMGKNRQIRFLRLHAI